MRDDDEVDQEGDQPARQDAVEQFRILVRVIGMRLHVIGDADAFFVVRHGIDPNPAPIITMSGPGKEVVKTAVRPLASFNGRIGPPDECAMAESGL